MSERDQDLVKDQFEHVRQLVEHEDTLINVRTTWTLVFHGFLFSSFVGGVGLYEKLRFGAGWLDPIGVGLAIVCLLGIFSAISGFLGVHAALGQLAVTTDWWRDRLSETRDSRFPPIYMHSEGKWRLSASYYLLILAVVWLVFLILVVGAPHFTVTSFRTP